MTKYKSAALVVCSCKLNRVLYAACCNVMADTMGSCKPASNSYTHSMLLQSCPKSYTTKSTVKFIALV